MNILPNEEQLEILGVVSSFAANELSVRRLQEPANRGAAYSQNLWNQLVELGWFGIGLDEPHGGLGLSIADEMLLARETGRQLISPTVLATSFTCHLASANGLNDLTAQLIGGQARVALALLRDGEITSHGLSGELSVFDADGVDYIVVCAAQACYLMTAEVLSHLSQAACTDESLSMHLGAVINIPIVASGNQHPLHLLLGQYIASALVGISEATRDAAAAYAKEREQFGKPIGGFQAINHLCADMAVRCEAAWSQSIFTALTYALNDPESPQAVASQAVMSEKAALENSRSNIQIHGGVGFTVEYDAHYYLKRSHVYRYCLNALIPAKTLLITPEVAA